ncbi:MAG: ABC transporter permease [Planctomycetota bacterium]
MNKIVTIAYREFLETVRTKAFFISVFLVPALIMIFVFGAERIGKLTERESTPLRLIALLDETGMVGAPLQQMVARYNEENPNRPFSLDERPPITDTENLAAEILAGKLYAYLVVPADVLQVPAEPVENRAACILARKDQQLQAGRDLDRMINKAVHVARFQSADPPIDPVKVQQLQQPVPLATVDVRSGEIGRDDMFVRLLTPFAFMFLLFMGTMQISYGLLTSLLEEKSTRVIEVLLSAVSPVQLMAGKIFGVVMVGVLLLAIWGGVGYYTADARGYGYLISGTLLLYVAMYFVPGFLLISAFLGAIGSACNTLKEAQSMASPITIVNLIPLVLWLPISQNPSSALSVALSYFPPITPFIMVLRVCADPDTPMWQIITTQILLWAAVIATIWAAGKIFRVGILMYGKPPSLREITRWLRYA